MLIRPQVFLIVLGLSACASQTPRVESTSVETEVRLAYQSSSPNDSVTQLQVTPEFEFTVGDNVSLVASARVRVDPADDLTPGEPGLEHYSDYSRPLQLGDHGIAELRDFYLEFGSDAFHWRIGKQQIVWGELDGFKNLDAVNPQSFREFILDDFESSRIGLWSVTSNFKLNAWNAEAFWSPDSTVHEIPTQGASFALSAPRYTFAANELAFSESQINYPDDSLSNSAYGLRLNRLTDSGLELAVMYLSGLDHSSVARSIDNQTEKLLIQEYQRRDVWGLSVSKALPNLVLRAELGYRPEKAFSVINEGALFIEERDQTTVAIGVDIDGPGSWFTNIQYLYDKVERSSAELVRPAKDKIVTFVTRRSWKNETLFFDLKWYSTDSFSDGLVRPEFRYLVNDNLTASIGVDAFYGETDGIFGQFDNSDRVVFKLQHVF